MKFTHAVLALLFAVAAFHVSYASQVTVHFSNGPIDMDAKFDSATKNIVFTINKNQNEYTVNIETSPFLDNVTYFSQESVWMNKTFDNKTAKGYTFNFSKVLAESPQNTNSESPCASIAQTNNVLCNFRLVNNYNTYPIYLKVENKLSDEPIIKILGSAFNNSQGHFYPKDAEYTKKSMENEWISIRAESEAKYDQPERYLTFSYSNTAGRKIWDSVRPSMFYFRCPNFNRLAIFEKDHELKSESMINLAMLGLPFDANYTCEYTMFLTEMFNNASLVQLKGARTLAIRANKNYTEWNLTFSDSIPLRSQLARIQEETNNLTRELNSVNMALNLTKMESKLDLLKFADALKQKSDESKKEVTKAFEDMRTLIIVLFALVGLLVVGLLIQCFVIMKQKKSAGGETWKSDVEIPGSAPYIRA